MNSESKKLNEVRLNKFLSRYAGVSRRQADEMIKKGQVFVNNKKISKLAVFVNPKKDNVRIKKRQVQFKKVESFYLMFNKPQKVLTTSKDPQGRPTVMDYLKKYKGRLFAVGRLDWDSEGLLILTNDGDFSDKVLHPKNKVSKTYLVRVKGQPKDSDLQKLLKGVSTPVGKKRALFVGRLSKRASSNAWVKIIINEGKKRQIRLMFEKIGFPVHRLRRTAIGKLKMNKLPKGASLRLQEKDLRKIFQGPKEIY